MKALHTTKGRARLTKLIAIAIMFVFFFSFSNTVALAKSEDMDWDSFSSDYYYKLMSEAQQKLYDGLYEECMEILTTTKTYENGYSDSVPCDPSLDEDQVHLVATTFMNSNPQFYFLEGFIIQKNLCDDAIKTNVSLGLYDDFTDGMEREKYTSEFVSTISRYMNLINLGKTDYEKERIAHGIITSRLNYAKHSKYNQSSASAFLGTQSVCAGYSEGLELLLNGAGIECMPVTSKDHEWLQAKIDGVWYAIDVTADDTSNTEDYLNVSDATLNKKDAELELDGTHIPLEEYTILNRPVCENDYWHDQETDNYGETGVYMNHEGNIALFCLHNPNTNEYFYTTDNTERRNCLLAGWCDNGIDGFFPARASEDTVTFYRFRNPNTGEHHYATFDGEIMGLIDAGWIDEGIAFYSLKGGENPVYRLYNPNVVTGTHFYISNAGGRDILLRYGWIDEGVGWYASTLYGSGFAVPAH